jgi:hypothetical protein
LAVGGTGQFRHQQRAAVWAAPWPYGDFAAAESAGGVASPLLAGFCFTLIGLIVPEGKGIRWPGFALVLLVAGGLFFIAAVQCGAWARQWTVTPQELDEWGPGEPLGRKEAEQRAHFVGFSMWSRRLRLADRGGIVALLAGVMVMLVPPGHITGMRWLAIVTAACGLVLESLWIASGWLLKGSPDCLYGNRPDVPKPGTPLLWLRGSLRLRRVARAFRPIIRVDP